MGDIVLNCKGHMYDLFAKKDAFRAFFYESA
jgi:hypothetical protein